MKCLGTCCSLPLLGLGWAGLTLSPTFSHELRRNYGSRGRSVNNATRRKFEKLLEVLYSGRCSPDHPISSARRPQTKHRDEQAEGDDTRKDSRDPHARASATAVPRRKSNVSKGL